MEMEDKILSYVKEKRDLLSKEYGEAKVDEVEEKLKPRRQSLLIGIRVHIAKKDLKDAKKTVDEFFELMRKEIVRSFN